jgi:hypothetical protein
MSSIFERTVIKQTRKARTGVPAQYLIVTDGEDLGLLEKFRNTRADIHPWKAFHGIGGACRYLGAFYGIAGRIQARNAVLIAAGLLS